MAAPKQSSLSIAELTDLYFTLEEPGERDAFLQLLEPLQGPDVDDFLRAMQAQDEDPCMRAAAAEMRLARGQVEALDFFAAQLRQPEDELALAQAVKVWVAQHGAAAYPLLAAIWSDDGRDIDQRKEALLGMETADGARTVAELLRWCAALGSAVQIRADLLEAAMLCLLRADRAAAHAALTKLRAQILAGSLAPPQQAELDALLSQGLDLST